MLAGYISPEKELGGENSTVVHISFVRVSKKSFVTRVSGLPNHEKALKPLKRLLCCNGNLKEGVLEFQGDQRDKLVLWLNKNLKGVSTKVHGV
nr:translation initiation factor SUI1 [Marseillevirus futianmevirus]